MVKILIASFKDPLTNKIIQINTRWNWKVFFFTPMFYFLVPFFRLNFKRALWCLFFIITFFLCPIHWLYTFFFYNKDYIKDKMINHDWEIIGAPEVTEVVWKSLYGNDPKKEFKKLKYNSAREIQKRADIENEKRLEQNRKLLVIETYKNNLISIKGITEDMALTIMNKYSTISKANNASIKELTKISGVGNKTAQQIKDLY